MKSDTMELLARLKSLEENLGRVIKGKDDVIRLSIITLLSRGHLLIEDVPGVGKTTLAHAIARSINGSFHRVQFTSDLLPSDITGVTIFNQSTNAFEFKKGPIFTHILLADEINRATPKTQSALLEAMNDYQVSVDGNTYTLPMPFFVIATQNPVEYEGTYPLPESQLDRFMMCLGMGYPAKEDEKKILSLQEEDLTPANLSPVLEVEDALFLQKRVESVKVDDTLIGYIVEILDLTRRRTDLFELGVSPRGGIALRRAAQAKALIEGRGFVLPDDIKTLAPHILAHRTIPSVGEGYGSIEERKSLIGDILAVVEVPL